MTLNVKLNLKHKAKVNLMWLKCCIIIMKGTMIVTGAAKDAAEKLADVKMKN